VVDLTRKEPARRADDADEQSKEELERFEGPADAKVLDCDWIEVFNNQERPIGPVWPGEAERAHQALLVSELSHPRERPPTVN
jgi:hypothetical protein